MDGREGGGPWLPAQEHFAPQEERRGTTYGDLAYDLDAMSREYALRHAGEAVPHGRQCLRPKVRSVTAARTRQRQRLSVVSVLGFLAVTILAVADTEPVRAADGHLLRRW